MAYFPKEIARAVAKEMEKSLVNSFVRRTDSVTETWLPAPSFRSYLFGPCIDLGSVDAPQGDNEPQTCTMERSTVYTYDLNRVIPCLQCGKNWSVHSKAYKSGICWEEWQGCGGNLR